MARAGSLYIRLALASVAAITLFYLLAPSSVNQISDYTANAIAQYKTAPTNDRISYDLTSPPAHTCTATVSRLQQQLIAAYAPILQGIRYVNLWGYLGESSCQRTWSRSDVAVCATVPDPRNGEQGRRGDLVRAADPAQHVWY